MLNVGKSSVAVLKEILDLHRELQKEAGSARAVAVGQFKDVRIEGGKLTARLELKPRPSA